MSSPSHASVLQVCSRRPPVSSARTPMSQRLLRGSLPLRTRNPNFHPTLSLACIAYLATVIDSVKFSTRSTRSCASFVSEQYYKVRARDVQKIY